MGNLWEKPEAPKEPRMKLCLILPAVLGIVLGAFILVGIGLWAVLTWGRA